MRRAWRSARPSFRAGRMWVAIPAVWLVLLGQPRQGWADLLWDSDFETVNGAAVVHRQDADPDAEPDPDPLTPPEPDAIDNSAAVGAYGEANGSDAPFGPGIGYLYKKYGQPGVPVIPSSLDPSGAAGATAFFFPNDRRAAIGTELPTGGVPGLPYDLDAATTVEGYFYSADPAPASFSTVVPRRLYSDMRGADDSGGRLACGLSVYAPAAAGEGLIAYEGFDYTGAALNGQNGGEGNWSGPWQVTSTVPMTLSDDDVSLSSSAYPFTAVGDRVSQAQPDGTGIAERVFSNPVDMGVDGNVLYVSALVQKTADWVDSTAEDIQIGFSDASAGVGHFRFFIGSADHWGVQAGSTTTGLAPKTPDDSVIPGVTYFVIAKLTTSAAGPDVAQLAVYGPGETVPESEDGVTWLLTNATHNSAMVLDRVRLRVGANCDRGEIDELHIGTTYESVTRPGEPIIGESPAAYNVLGIAWYSTAAGAVVETKGTTEILPNTWYYFAMVYDRSTQSITGYLKKEGDPALTTEIQIANADLAAAGSGPIGIGNLRQQGVAEDRNWYGMVDEIRVYDAALTTGELMVNGPPRTANLVWSSGFETDYGAPVVHDQAPEAGRGVDAFDIGLPPPFDAYPFLRAGYVSSIDSGAGLPIGWSRPGYAAVPPSIHYARYGRPGIPALPTELDPRGLAGDTALINSPNRRAALTTNVPSDTGNLGSAMTAEGYFNLLAAGPTAGTEVGMRLVSQKRSADDGQTRIAIGLEAYPPGSPTGNVLAVFYRSQTAHQAHGEAAATVNHVLLEPVPRPIQPGQWHHFAVVYDGRDGDPNNHSIRAYLDGELRISFTPVDLAPAGSAPISLLNNRTAGTSSDRGFDGMVDRVRIYDEVVAPVHFLVSPCNVPPRYDTDADGDVDVNDFAVFQLCFNGSGRPWPAELSPLMQRKCMCSDGDGDADVDVNDFANFQLCFNGSGRPPSQDCLW